MTVAVIVARLVTVTVDSGSDDGWDAVQPLRHKSKPTVSNVNTWRLRDRFTQPP